MKTMNIDGKQNANLLKRQCRYGTGCYRKNPSHFAEFSHPADNLSTKSDPIRADRCDNGFAKCSTSYGSVKSDEIFGFYLFRVRGLQYGSSPTITLSNILDPNFGPLESSAQFNFMFDVEWLLQRYPKPFRDAPLLLVHGAQGKPKQKLEETCALHSHIECIQAPIRLPSGVHHTKMMLLQYEKGLRVVIHTANMIPEDWNLRTQGIWMSPLLPPTNAPPSLSDSTTHFREDLEEYLKSYGSAACQNTTSGIGKWIGLLNRYDFRLVRVFLIASSSGAFTGSDMKKFGHLRLNELLKIHTPETPSSWPIIGQFSSIGSLGLQPTDWLTTEWSSSFAGRGARGIRLIFPCVEDVRNSLEGYSAGGCLPYVQRTAYRQPWLRQFLHRWVADAHSRAIPHIKTYSRISPDGCYATWFLLTSANLSKAAWGVLQKNRTQLAMRSYELGVLFVPSQFEPNSNCFLLGGPHQASTNVKERTKLPESMRPSSITFPLPYQLPPEPYADDDQPWIVDKLYTSPDIYGHTWPPE